MSNEEILNQLDILKKEFSDLKEDVTKILSKELHSNAERTLWVHEMIERLHQEDQNIRKSVVEKFEKLKKTISEIIGE